MCRNKLSPYLSNILSKLSVALFDRKLDPITEKEQELINEIRAKISCIKSVNYEATPDADKVWVDFVNRIRHSIMTEDLRNFLRWDIIKESMTSSGLSHLIDLLILRLNHRWKSCWKSATEESSAGNPLPYFFYPRSSGVLIQHAANINYFENLAGKQINEMDIIFEFGGGYGSMCRLIHNLGFNGIYLIFDFPEVSMLQQYFLKSLGFSISKYSSPLIHKKGVYCLSDKKILEKIFSSMPMDSFKNKLFLATWSISETPIHFRQEILKSLSTFSNFLIVYQNNFAGIDNLRYFNNWIQSYESAMHWHHCQMKYKPGSNYLIGVHNGNG